jgi:hypothetical protein
MQRPSKAMWALVVAYLVGALLGIVHAQVRR